MCCRFVLRIKEVFWSDRVCCNVARIIHKYTRHNIYVVAFSVDIPIDDNNNNLPIIW